MNTDIHRLLDEAFAGVDMTPDAQDLKEEVRANLVARTAELEAAGKSSSDAARDAIAELGDVPVGDLADGVGGAVHRPSLCMLGTAMRPGRASVSVRVSPGSH